RGTVRDACLVGRVLCPGPVRRSDRDLHPDAQDRPDERDLRVRRLPGRGRRADGDGGADPRADRSGRASRAPDPELVPGSDPELRERRLRDRGRVTNAGSIDYRGALEAVERILNRGGGPDEVLRAVLEALHVRGVASARVNMLENGRLVERLGVGQEADRIVAPVGYEGSEFGSLELAADDRAVVERVATLISPYVARLQSAADR